MATSKLTLLIDLQEKISGKFNNLQKNWSMGIDKMRQKFNQFFGKTNDDLDKLRSKFSQGGSGGGFGFGMAAGVGMQAVEMAKNAITDLAGEAVDSVDSLEKFRQTMEFAGFDPKAIETAKKAVNKYAADTVYDLSTISNTTAQLAANGIKDYLGLTQAAGNLNAVAGGNAETFKSVAMMLTQTAGAGKLTTENWNQLSNAIPGASGKIQEALRKNGAFTGNFREAMEKGLITSDEFNKALMDLGNQPIAVEAAKSTKTFEGALGQMKASVVDAFSNIIQAIGVENITGAITSLAGVVETALGGIVWFINELKTGNPIIGILVALILSITAGIAAYNIVMGLATLKTTLWTGAQWLLNAAMTANPIGLIIAAIVALIAIIVMAVVKYKEWGATLLWFLGPIGQVVSALKLIYDHWESIKNAFKTEGIIGGLKRLGQVLLDVVLQPLEKMLGLFAQLPDKLGGKLAKDALAKVHSWRANMNLVIPEPKNDDPKKTNPKPAGAASLYAAGAGGSGGNTAGTKTSGKSKLAGEVNKVAGDNKQVKNITIKIDALNKGGINMNGNSTAGMTLQDVENWFNDAMMRIMRNAELS